MTTAPERVCALCGEPIGTGQFLTGKGASRHVHRHVECAAAEPWKAEVARLAFVAKCFDATALAESERANRAEAEVARLRAVLSRIARQGAHVGVDGHPWRHWSIIAADALTDIGGAPTGEPKP